MAEITMVSSALTFSSNWSLAPISTYRRPARGPFPFYASARLPGDKGTRRGRKGSRPPFSIQTPKLCYRSHLLARTCPYNNHIDKSGLGALTSMLAKKANIDPAVRTKLEELGVDTVRSKLVWIMNVEDLAQQNELQPHGVGLSASRQQIQDWLREKAAREILWVRVGVIAAVLAAVFSLLSWYAPLIKISISQVSSGQ